MSYLRYYRDVLSLPKTLGSEEYEQLETLTANLSRSYERILARPELKEAIGDSFEIQGLVRPSAHYR